MARIWVSVAMALLALRPPLVAQGAEGGKAGPRATLDPEREIALARSAAPDAVTAEATVLIWNGDRYHVAEEGSNGVTCYVSRTWPQSLEPHCFDEEGSRTILPIHLRQVEMWHRGASRTEIDAEIAHGLATGAFRVPTRPAMSYMMSAGQRLVSDDGEDVGRWEPHLMIYYPYLSGQALGLGTAPSTEAAVVVDPGTPLSNLMIVLERFVEPRDPPAPRPDTIRPGAGDRNR